jgi:hypothetical protein
MASTNNIIKEIKKHIENGNFLYGLLIIALIFAIIPFIFLIRYNLPGASDDMLNASYLNQMPYFESVLEWYNSGFNGRYANAVIMQLPGKPFMNTWFAQTIPYFIFSLLFVSLLFLVRSFKKQISFKKSILISLLTFTFFIEYNPSIHEFYWFSGTSVYIIPAIIYIFLLGTLFRSFNKTNNIIILIFLMLGLFFIIGSHETWMLYGVFTVFGFSIFELINKRKLKVSTYVLLIWTLVLFGLFVFAPGNSNRLSNEGTVVDNANFWGSSVMSIFDSFSLIKKWFLNFGFFLIIASALTLPRNNDTNNASIVRSLLIIAAAFVAVFVSVFVVKYSLGHLTELRLRGIIPGFIVASLLVIYLVCNIKFTFLEKLTQRNVNLSYGLLLSGIVFYSASSENLSNAYIDIFSERAKVESSQVLWAQNYIKNSKEETLYLPNINKGTRTLYFLSIPKANTWYNWSLKSYYNKNVILDEKLSFENFVFLQDTTALKNLIIKSENEFSAGYEFSNETINSLNPNKVKIKAIFENPGAISENNKILLVFQYGDYWKGIPVSEIIKNNNNGFVTFSEKIPDKIKNPDVFKIYFWNQQQDSLVISSFKVELE